MLAGVAAPCHMAKGLTPGVEKGRRLCPLDRDFPVAMTRGSLSGGCSRTGEVVGLTI